MDEEHKMMTISQFVL